MRRSVQVLLLTSCIVGVGVAGENENKSAHSSPFVIQSLNTPDPVFVTSGDSIEISVSSDSHLAIDRAVVTLNGRDVTFALAPSASTELRGTLTGLRPGINTLQVFGSRKARTPSANLKVSRAKAPTIPCALESFSRIKLPIP